MKKLIAAVGLSLALIPASGQADVSPDLTPERFGPVKVVVYDYAKGGCWTNLGEVQTYAEDKLRNLGFVVVQEIRGVLSITVTSSRHSPGGCYGSTSVRLVRFETVNGLFGILEVASAGRVFTEHENANTITLDLVKRFADELAEEIAK